MPKASPIKVSFNAGELSPLLDGRTDQSKYFNGCSILENFIPTVQGPIIRRGGSYHINETKVSANRSWLRDFRFNVTQSYMLEFGDLYIRFFANQGVVLEATKAITGITQANPGVVTSAGHGYSNGDLIYIAAVGGMTQVNGKFFKVSAVAANTFALQDVDGNNVNTTSFTAYTAGGTVARDYQVTTTYAVADLTDALGNFNMRFIQQADIMYILLGGYAPRKLTRAGNTNWTLTTTSLANGPFKDLNSDSTISVYASSVYSQAVTGAANNGAGAIRITVASTTGLTTGDSVNIAAVTGTVEANGYWLVTVIDATHFDLQNSAFSVAYVAGGTVYGAEGTAVTLTASSAIFTANHVGTLFYLEQNPRDVAKQWEVAKSSTAGDFRRSGTNNYLSLTTATTGTVKPTHTNGAVYDGDTGVQWLYYDSSFGIIQIDSIGGGGTTATGTVITNLPRGVIGTSNKVSGWAHSFFSAAEGWPEGGIIYKERLSLYRGIEVAMSVSGDYENFARKIGGVITDDAAIRITVPATDPIRWMQDAGNLISGTGGNEISIAKITTTQPLAPGNIEANKQTTYGCRNVQSIEVGNAILFVTRSGAKLREVTYSFEQNSYVAVDVTVLSEHIAKGDNGADAIVQMAYQQEPYSIVWCVTKNGRLLGFTYNREQDVLAWHRHPLGAFKAIISNAVDNGAGLIRLTVDSTAGLKTGDYVNISAVLGTTEANRRAVATVINATTVDLQGTTFANEYESGGVLLGEAYAESVGVIPSPDGTRDDVWLIVKRTINGITRRYVELLQAEFMGTDYDIADAFYVDSGLTYSGTATSTISGLDHLLGMVVDILADGGTHPQKTVVQLAAGKIGVTLDYEASTAQIGLPAPCKVRTMRIDAGSATGTAQGKLKKISKILLRFLKTLGGSFGASEDKTDPIIYREGDGPMDTPPPMISGDVSADFPSGTDTEGYMMFINDDPLPVTLITVAANVDTQDD